MKSSKQPSSGWGFLGKDPLRWHGLPTPVLPYPRHHRPALRPCGATVPKAHAIQLLGGAIAEGGEKERGGEGVRPPPASDGFRARFEDGLCFIHGGHLGEGIVALRATRVVLVAEMCCMLCLVILLRFAEASVPFQLQRYSNF